MKRPTGRSWILACHRGGRRKSLLFTLAALPVFQAVGCFPNLGNAVNFELQALVSTVLLNAFNTVVQNLLGL